VSLHPDLLKSQLINAIAQTLQQMGTYAKTVKGMIPQLKGLVGISNVDAIIRHEENAIVVGVKFEFVGEEVAEEMYNEILERLGLKPPSKEKKVSK